MKKTNKQATSLTGYYPLEYLTTSLITVKGMQSILTDKSISPETIELLKKSELSLFKDEKQKQYSYLLEEHDAKEVYLKMFKMHRSIGKTHLSILIKENKDQTYAELVAAYCSDKKIPYLAALIMLEDYKKVRGCLTMYDSTAQGVIQEVAWFPPATPIVPPKNYRKMLDANIHSVPGINDNYVLAALKDYSFNKNMTAKALRISKYLLESRLKKLEVLREDGSLNKKKIENILKKQIISSSDKEQATVTSSRNIKSTHIVPPKKKSTNEDGQSSMISEYEIRNTYMSVHSIEETAKMLDVSYSKVLSVIQKWTKQESVRYSRGSFETLEEPISTGTSEKYIYEDPVPEPELGQEQEPEQEPVLTETLEKLSEKDGSEVP